MILKSCRIYTNLSGFYGLIENQDEFSNDYVSNK